MPIDAIGWVFLASFFYPAISHLSNLTTFQVAGAHTNHVLFVDLPCNMEKSELNTNMPLNVAVSLQYFTPAGRSDAGCYVTGD